MMLPWMDIKNNLLHIHIKSSLLGGKGLEIVFLSQLSVVLVLERLEMILESNPICFSIIYVYIYIYVFQPYLLCLYVEYIYI